MENNQYIENMIRTGAVSAVDKENRLVRVRYDNTGTVSGWIYVLKLYGGIVVASDGSHTHTYPAGQVDGESSHVHGGSYLPETVLDIAQDGQHDHTVEEGEETTGPAEAHSHDGSKVPKTTLVIESQSHNHTYPSGAVDGISGHNHDGTHLSYWMPEIKDRVLVICVPIFNGDAFVMGGL